MTRNTITMIDYGSSNMRSVQKAFEFASATVQVTAEPHMVRRAGKLVLPGVGAFGAGMGALRERGLESAISEAVRQGVPLLGICLGMQFLFDTSDEIGAHQGLGLIPGRVTRFPTSIRSPLSALPLKIPHMGWNQIEPAWESPLLNGIEPGCHVYFVHSYYCEPVEPTTVIAWSDYGIPFAAIVAQDNVFGIQFHPEKSQRIGLRILRNFVEKVR